MIGQRRIRQSSMIVASANVLICLRGQSRFVIGDGRRQKERG
jgi:hypothetical protein